MDGSVYVYEWAQNAPTQDSGSIYVYEYPQNVPQGSNGNGSIYAYEYAVPNTNPAKMHVYDGTQWVHIPDYFWNGTTWQQIV